MDFFFLTYDWIIIIIFPYIASYQKDADMQISLRLVRIRSDVDGNNIKNSRLMTKYVEARVFTKRAQQQVNRLPRKVLYTFNPLRIDNSFDVR